MEHMERPMTMNEARSEIQIINEMANKTGNIDSENHVFKEIIKALESGQITPQIAVNKARAVLESRDEI